MSKQLVANCDILVSCRLIEAFHWIRAHYPYWDRNGGRDHIVVGGQLLADWLAGWEPSCVGGDPAPLRFAAPCHGRSSSCRYRAVTRGIPPLQLSVHDEGSCWVPAVLRPAIIISHWGRTELPHVSGTSYSPDNYSVEIRYVLLVCQAFFY